MIDSDPLVSIVIPTFNRENVIKETLDSVTKQTYLNWECIVVDDGSTDLTVQILKEYSINEPRMKYFLRPKNRKKGGNACRNLGFEKSRGDYVQWFDSDDIMHPEMLEEKVSNLRFSDYDFVVCEGIEFKSSITNTFGKWDAISSSTPALDHAIGDISFHTNGPLFRRSFLKDKKLFDESLQRKQEWEFYTRLLLDSKNYYHIKRILYYFRIHEKSINGFNNLDTLKSMINANRKVFKNINSKGNLINNKAHIKKHFTYKLLDLLKKSFKNGLYYNSLLALTGILEINNFKDFYNSLLNVIKNPKIIKRLFS